MTTLNRAEDIALEIHDRLSQISIANGYETDIGLRVYRGRLMIDKDVVPCSVIVEGEDRQGQATGLTNIQTFQHFTVGGYEVCDPDHPNDTGHKIIRDLKRVLFKDGVRLGGKVRSIDYKGRHIGPRADGVGIVFAIVQFEVEYAENLTAP